MTEYVILKRDQDGRWAELTERPNARSQQAALQSVFKSGEYTADVIDGHAPYVAVPARSWKPVTVQVETKTALKFS